jgi:hypothetical protein
MMTPEIDPLTQLPICSPRTYKLRQLQRKDGKDCSNLRLEQLGLAHIGFMHHVSKIVEGKTESFRVRICRTCSGLPILIELGSYADVESALLVNDVHEILQNRTRQLHLLVPGDIEYAQSLTVRKRGGLHENMLIHIIQERLLKSLSKKVNSDGDPEDDGLVVNGLGGREEAADEDGANGRFSNSQNPLITSGIVSGGNVGTASSSTSSSRSLPNGKISIGNAASDESGKYSGGPRTGNTVTFRDDVADNNSSTSNKVARRSSDDDISAALGRHYGGGLDNLMDTIHKGRGSSSQASFHHSMNHAYPSGSHTSSNINSSSHSSSSKFAGMAANNLSSSQQLIPVTSPPLGPSASASVPSHYGFSHSTNSLRSLPPTQVSASMIASTMLEQVKNNLCDVHKTFVSGYLVDSQHMVQEILSALVALLQCEVETSGVTDNNHELTKLRRSKTSNLIFKLGCAWVFPRSLVMSLLISAFPEDSVLLPKCVQSMQELLPDDGVTSNNFGKLQSIAHQAMLNVKSSFTLLLEQLNPRSTNVDKQDASELNSNSGLNTSSSGSGSGSGNTVSQLLSMLEPVDHFIKVVSTSALWFNQSLRLMSESVSSLDGTISNAQPGLAPFHPVDMETRIFGLHSQLLLRVRTCLPFIMSLRALLAEIERHHESITLHDNAYTSNSNSDASANRVAISRGMFELVSRLTAYSRKAAIGIAGLVVCACHTSITVSSVSGDAQAVILSSIPLCRQAFTVLRDHIEDSAVIQDLLQGYLDLCVYSYLQQPPASIHGNTAKNASGDESTPSAAGAASHGVIIYTIASQLVQQSKKTSQTINTKVQGLAAVLVCELNLRTCVSIFIAAMSLRETDFLRKFGYTSADLLKSIYDKMRSLIDWFRSFHCIITSAQTLVSVYLLIDCCFMHCDMYVILVCVQLSF